MRVVLQRVTSASVTVDSRIIGSIEHGLLVFLGIENEDNISDVEWLVAKLPKLRIFADENQQMNKSVADLAGEILVISQFTLSASTRKGTRPSFNRAAAPELARPLYNQFVGQLSVELGRTVATGEFGADMQVALVNDGPVTLIIDSKLRE